MKRICFFVILFVIPFLFTAQINQDELQLLQAHYGMDKREIIDEFVELSEEQESVFWELYDAYELERKALGEKRFELLQKYVDEYGTVQADNADNFMKEAIAIRTKSDKLRDSYYAKIRMQTDPVVAMQFYQIELYLSDLVRLELLEKLYTTKK